MNEYAIAFIFDKDAERVLLIKKNQPDWQKDKLNGIGGCIKPLEEPKAALAREVKEKTGLQIPEDQWTPVCAYRNDLRNGLVFFAMHQCKESWVPTPWTQMTDEALVCVPVSAILDPNVPLVPNLRWLIPMALEARSFTDSKTRGYVVMDSDKLP